MSTVAAGSVLGHYRFLAPLGAVGVGEVWLAEDQTLKRKVALQVLPTAVALDPERLARFQHEAEAVAALSHPNIVFIRSVEEADGVRLLTMELVDGQGLDKVVPRGGAPLVQVLDVGIALGDALLASHEEGIVRVHRDPKPANVMPGRIRRALGRFHTITGLTAVTSFATPLAGSVQPPALSPPVHPRCARQLRSGRTAPCRRQWFIHTRSSRRSPRVHSHTCPIGLRCSCVPIQFDGRLIGVAKLVVGSETTGRTFSTATSVLELLVTGICQESLVAGLSHEVGVLRQCLVKLRQMQSRGDPAAAGTDPPAAAEPEAVRRQNLTLVDSALSYLQRHYQAPALSLPAVAEALGCNPRYLTARFTLIAGERMHAYLVRLRVAHACRLLMDTDVPIKEAAYASGFRGTGGLARAFQRIVGVSPGEYRRVFAVR